ncbi:tyrosine-type recombinase/integrase [Bradyrhizobium embrapense]
MRQANDRALTKRYVESLKPGARPVVVFDAGLAGFGVRVMPSGHRSYFVQYRNKEGRSRWYTIGAHGKVTVDQARTIAKRVLHSAADGKDPAAERETFRTAPTVSDLLDRYLTEHVKKRNAATTQAEVERLVTIHIRPALGGLKVAAVTRNDISKLHRALSGTPRQANFALSVCSKAFSLAELWDMRPDGTNPCKRIERNAEMHRERFLSGDELSRLGAVLRQAETTGLPWKVDESKPNSKHLPGAEHRFTVYSRVTTAVVELLLYTGCRLSEVLSLRWDQIDFNAGTILLRKTKAGKPQTVTLNAPARQVLNSLSRDKDCPWVLPGKRISDKDQWKPLAKDAMEAAWQRIRAVANINDVRMHDLRHTVGTYAGQSGANAFLVRDLLRHANVAMTGRYVNKADDPVRALNDLVGERIAASLEGRPAAQVIRLRSTFKG